MSSICLSWLCIRTNKLSTDAKLLFAVTMSRVFVVNSYIYGHRMQMLFTENHDLMAKVRSKKSNSHGTLQNINLRNYLIRFVLSHLPDV